MACTETQKFKCEEKEHINKQIEGTEYYLLNRSKSEKEHHSSLIVEYCQYCRSSHYFKNACPLFGQIFYQSGREEDSTAEIIAAYDRILEVEEKSTTNITGSVTKILADPGKVLETEKEPSNEHINTNGGLEISKPYVDGHENTYPSEDQTASIQDDFIQKLKNKKITSQIVSNSESEDNFCEDPDDVEKNSMKNDSYNSENTHHYYCTRDDYTRGDCESFEKASMKIQQIHAEYLKHSKENSEKNCNFCEGSDHDEVNCIKKMGLEYCQKYLSCNYCKKFDHSKHNCPLVKTTINGMLGEKIENPYIEHPKAVIQNGSKICSFCGTRNHKEENCHEKFQIDYYTRYCNSCKDYGHTDHSCLETIMHSKHNNSNKKKLKVFSI